ncbi:uncharacterized protein LOC127868591 isoform X1 [Dreissena polymorpha]|uniref:uncharacterized protein LOC127868591 isoform X1 n=1 Tax=Dreissena polymorpha TaxID=45954 RepID=UPI002264AD0B|nr:uncharacterized protein LOC127868591 isoform X1 [Dreissena polymorpha]
MAANHLSSNPPDMGDLLQYFESRSRALDEEGQPLLDIADLQFMSLIRFNGVPILPPVLTPGRRDEMKSYKREAVHRAARIKSKRQTDLQAKVQSIVASVEEKRAAKQASRSSSKSSSPVGKEAHMTSKPSMDHKSKASKTGEKSGNGAVAAVTEASSKSPSRSSSAISASAASKSGSVPFKSQPVGSGEARKRDSHNYKSLGKIGFLVKQKSYSSQHLDQIGLEGPGKAASLSPKPSGLFPHPPVGRPPSRGSGLRQSSSTPDLRTIDIALGAEDLHKPMASRHLSPKGGRPQAPERDIKNVPVENSSVKGLKEDKLKRPESKDSRKSNKIDKQEVRYDQENKRSSEKKTSENVAPRSEKSPNKVNSSDIKYQDNTLQNPLALLEQQISHETENERYQRYENRRTGSGSNHKEEVRSELDPIQRATAELFPFPISEEQALATLDSLQPDFASLELAEDLPSDYNGIPLTSDRQKQIIHILTKLSQALNMEDTLTSTGGLNVNHEQVKDPRVQGSKSENWSDSRSVHYGASGASQRHSEHVPSGDINESLSSNPVESVSNSNSFQNTSGNSSHSRSRLSPGASSSILSSASSVSASKSRMSPKSLKNTVHFNSLVKEISTSASQSFEDKISFRKLDITPKSSENFDDMESVALQGARNNLTDTVAASSHISAMPAERNMLSKVALSPSVDSSVSSPGEIHNHNPFEDYNEDGEFNTSDKENEYIPAGDESPGSDVPTEIERRSGRGQQVWNVYTARMPAGPVGDNHPALFWNGMKSDLTESLKEKGKDGSNKVLQENISQSNMDTQYYYGTTSTDLGRYMHEKITPHASISSFQEEITKSYLLSQHNFGKISLSVKNDNAECEKDNSVLDTSEVSGVDFDESVVHLPPVIFTGVQKSLQENRSMLDDEAQIRSNLQRVLLEDSESESDTGESEDEIHYEEKTADEDESESGNNNHTDEVYEELSNNGIDSDGAEEEEHQEHQDDAQSSVQDASQKDSETVDNSETDALKMAEYAAYLTQVTEHSDQVENEDKIVVHGELEPANIYGNSGNNELTELKTCLDGKHEPAVIPVTEHNNSNENNNDIIQVEEQNNAEENEADNQQYDVQENEAKAEHIQKYLSQVHEQSLLHEEDSEDENADTGNRQKSEDIMNNISELIQTFTSRIQSMNHLSQEELFRMQTEQFELIQKRLIEHQQAQLEELFVSQRREQMNLQQEIESYQTRIKEKQSSFDMMTLRFTQPNNLTPQMSRSLPQVAQAWPPTRQVSQSAATMSPPFQVKPVPVSYPYQNPNMPFTSSSYGNMPYPATRPFIDPRAFMEANIDNRAGVGMSVPMGFPQDPNISSISHNTSYSTIPFGDPGVIHGNLITHVPQVPRTVPSQGVGSSQASNPFIYPSSPSLLINPNDRDNVSDVSGFAKATAKQLVFSNQSTPVPAKHYKPIQHSPMKQTSAQRNKGKVSIPEKAFEPWMQQKFARVTAAVRGYLTRRLLRTNKVQEIVKTIDDTRNFAFKFQSETPMRTGHLSREDRVLLERIVNQLQAGLLDIHEIFFTLPMSERMSLIATQRQLEQEKLIRDSGRHSLDNVSRSQPKLSKATLKALERKKKAQLAEEAVFGSMELRPKSAPPTTSSPALDISGPLRRHYHSLFARALRPIQGQMSPIYPDQHITVRELKERPKTASDRRKSEGQTRSKKASGSKTSKSSASTSAPKSKSSSSQKSAATQSQKQPPSVDAQKHSNAPTTTIHKQPKKTEKAWR